MSTNHQQEPGHHGSEFIPTNQPPGAVTNTQNMPTMLSPHQAESYGYGAESTFASAEYYRSNRLTRKELLERASELPYHRLSHVNPRARWFTPVLEGLLIASIYFVLLLIVSFALLAFAVMLRVPYDHLTDLQRVYANVFKTPLVFITFFISIIPVIPAIFIARLITNFKPLGLIHSIAGRMRWSYLGVFLGFGFLIFGLYNVGNLVLAGSLTTQNSVHPLNSGMFWLYIVLILLIVPFQCYAEELLFRGYLMQTVGRWLKNPAWAIIIPAPIFMVLHGYGLWGLLSVLTMALIAGFLCWYTGGLEAGIGLHIANNISGIILGLLGLADPFDANHEAQALDFVQALILQLAFAGLVYMYTYRQKRKAALNQGQDAVSASSAEGGSMGVEAPASSSDAPATAAPAPGAAHAAVQPGMSVKNAAASPAADNSASAPQGSQALVQSQPVQPAASAVVNAKPAQDNASVKSASSAAPANPQTAKEHRAPERNIAEKPAAQAPSAKPVEGARKSEQNDTSVKASAPAQPERSAPAHGSASANKPASVNESVPTHESTQSQKPAQTTQSAQAHESSQPQKPVHTNESAQAERPTTANTAAHATGKEAQTADKPAQSAQARTIADELKPAVVAPAASEKAPSGIDLDAAQKAARASAQKAQQGSNRVDSSVRASGAQGSASNAAAPQKEAASASAAQSDDTKNPSSKNYTPDTSTMSIPVQNALSAYERAKAQALAQQKETTQQKEAARQKESGQGTSVKNAAAENSAAASQTSRAQQEASGNTSEVPWATAPIPKISPEAAQSHKQGSTDASPWTSAFPVIPKPKK
ncbi:CPBP family glutamic-type intramembrane protease [Rothia dentocariosa]|uniref:CPBP family glutamic-type intramembrane protease n=1 Tax=Rothia dentocariosa TaxID=2047 RepID=UPI002040759F|nr:CPBP family glutamic-type intramembrane protease [Rothia dentocariosa]MCM3438347.1 CPBP family glutamic-type intramembrane protease [Rothia dentocariosa]